MPAEVHAGEFEVSDLLFGAQGYINASFWENEQATVPAQHIVSAQEHLHVRIEWEVESPIRHHLTGTWRVKVDVESVGTAGEYSSPVYQIPFDPVTENPYVQIITLSPGVLQPAPGGTVYIIAVTLSSLDAQGNSGHIWGFVKGPAIMFVPAI